MPPLEESDFVHAAVLWEKVRDDRRGEPVVKSPREIECRWVSGRRQSVSRTGEVIALEANLATAEDVPEGSVVWRGELRDFVNDGTNRFYKIETSSETSDVKGRETTYEYGLVRFKNSLPEIDPDA